MDNTFPVRLRELRKKEGLSQRVLSELCGLNRKAVYKYEHGKAVPGMRSLRALAKNLGVSIDELLGDPEK